MQQLPGNETAPAKEHDEGKPCHHGRCHGRQECHHLEEPFAGHIGVVDAIGKKEAEHDGRGRGNKGRKEGMSKYQYKFPACNGSDPVGLRGNQKDFYKGINNKHAEKEEHRRNADEKRRLPKEQFQFHTQSCMFMACIFFVHNNSLFHDL